MGARHPIVELVESTLARLEARFGPAGGDDRPLVLVPDDAPAAARPERPALLCSACRLVQEHAAACRHCREAPLVAPGDAARLRLLSRPSLLPWRRRVSGVDLAARFTATRDEPRLTGVARRARAALTSHVTDVPCLASGLALGRASSDVVLRFARHEPFLVDRAGRPPLLVVGELVLLAAEADELPRQDALRVMAPPLWELGVPSWLTRVGLPPLSWDSDPMYRLFETTVREGDTVEVLGEPAEELVPDAHGPRDVFLEVLRGRPWKPVLARIVERAAPSAAQAGLDAFAPPEA